MYTCRQNHKNNLWLTEPLTNFNCKYVWSHAAGANYTIHTNSCPCTSITVARSSPTFVKENYYCETGNSIKAVPIMKKFMTTLVVVHLLVIVALHLEHHGSTVNLLKLRVELLKCEPIATRATPMKPLYTGTSTTVHSAVTTINW